jgi:hypothetical protein
MVDERSTSVEKCMENCGNDAEWGISNYSKKSLFQVPLFPPHISYILVWNRTRAFAFDTIPVLMGFVCSSVRFVAIDQGIRIVFLD